LPQPSSFFNLFHILCSNIHQFEIYIEGFRNLQQWATEGNYQYQNQIQI